MSCGLCMVLLDECKLPPKKPGIKGEANNARQRCLLCPLLGKGVSSEYVAQFLAHLDRDGVTGKACACLPGSIPVPTDVKSAWAQHDGTVVVGMMRKWRQGRGTKEEEMHRARKGQQRSMFVEVDQAQSDHCAYTAAVTGMGTVSRTRSPADFEASSCSFASFSSFAFLAEDYFFRVACIHTA